MKNEKIIKFNITILWIITLTQVINIMFNRSTLFIITTTIVVISTLIATVTYLKSKKK